MLLSALAILGGLAAAKRDWETHDNVKLIAQTINPMPFMLKDLKGEGCQTLNDMYRRGWTDEMICEAVSRGLLHEGHHFGWGKRIVYWV